MLITFDPAKRSAALEGRGLDFVAAAQVFAGRTVSFPDLRYDYGEERIVTFGRLAGRMVCVVWNDRSTPAVEVRHVISMRKANAREQARYVSSLIEVE